MKERYSFQADRSVPTFDASRPLAVMDGDCALCAFGARIIDRLDRRNEIRIATIDTTLGRALLAHFGQRSEDPESWLFIVDGTAFEGVDAMIRAGRQCGGLGRLLVVLLVVPRPLRAGLYQWIARNRYRMFGRQKICELPSPSLRARLIG